MSPSLRPLSHLGPTATTVAWLGTSFDSVVRIIPLAVFCSASSFLSTIFFDNGPLDYSLDFSIKPKVFITDQLKTPRLNNNTFEEILLSLSSEKILPNIKSRYPGQALVDYDEKFVISYAYILHELCYKYKRTREFFGSESILK